MDIELFTPTSPLTPVETYDTTFVYTGLSRIDSAKREVSQIRILENGRWHMETSAWEGSALSRSYATERVTVQIYSTTPWIWSERTSPHKIDYFREIENK